MTRAQQAGLRVEDVPRPSLAKRRCRYKLDAQVRQALGLNKKQPQAVRPEVAQGARLTTGGNGQEE